MAHGFLVGWTDGTSSYQVIILLFTCWSSHQAIGPTTHHHMTPNEVHRLLLVIFSSVNGQWFISSEGLSAEAMVEVMSDESSPLWMHNGTTNLLVFIPK